MSVNIESSAASSGLAIDGNDMIYAADSESTPRSHPGWLKGIRIGSLKDGKVTTFVPPHKTDSPDGAMGEGIAIDAAGNIYTAEATVRGVTNTSRTKNGGVRAVLARRRGTAVASRQRCRQPALPADCEAFFLQAFAKGR